MRKSKKTYKRPKKIWDKVRIGRDKKLKDTFGLFRAREIWNAETILRKYRRLARELVGTREKEKEKALLSKLVKMGILEKGSRLDDVLGMGVENVLNRRLQTVVFTRGLANTQKHARQMIVHGHIKVNGRVSKHPSRIILKEEEDKIEVIKTVKGTSTKPVSDETSVAETPTVKVTDAETPSEPEQKNESD